MNPLCILQILPYLKSTIVLKIYIQHLMVIIILYTNFRKKCIMRILFTNWSRLDSRPQPIWIRIGTGGARPEVGLFYSIQNSNLIERFDRGGLGFLSLLWYVCCAIKETRVRDLRCRAVRGYLLSLLFLLLCNIHTITKSQVLRRRTSLFVP